MPNWDERTKAGANGICLTPASLEPSISAEGHHGVAHAVNFLLL